MQKKEDSIVDKKVVILTQEQIDDAETLVEAMKRESNLLHELVTQANCMKTCAYLICQAKTDEERTKHTEALEDLSTKFYLKAFECKKIPNSLLEFFGIKKG